MKRRLVGPLAAVCLVSAVLVMAVPANAATRNVTVNCATVPTTQITFSPTSVTADASDTIVLSASGPYTYSVTATGATGLGTLSGLVGPVTYTPTGNSGGSIVLTGTNSFCNGVVATLTFTGSAPAPSPSSTSGIGPSPVVQQFGRPGSGTCEGVASSDLNWAGAESGGWSESWAEWMNGGLGGAVCTRTLTYRSSTGMWSAA